MIQTTVYVYDKKGSLNNTPLAQFEKPVYVSSENAVNILQDPKFSIETNGTSTFTFTIQANSIKWEICKDPTNIWLVNGREYTAINELAYVYDDNRQNVTVTLKETWVLLKFKTAKIYNGDVDLINPDFQTIAIYPKIPPNVDLNKWKLNINNVVYNDNDVKDIRGILQPRGSAGYAIWALLKPTGWKLGVCDMPTIIPSEIDPNNDYGAFNVLSDMQHAFYNLELVRGLYGGIFIWDSVNKILHYRDDNTNRRPTSDFNTWNGLELVKGKNLQNVIKEINNEITPKVIPLGNGNLGIRSINNGIDYLIDTQLFSQYPNELNIQNNDIYDPKALMYWGNNQLEKLKKPREQYKITFVDRRNDPKYQHENFTIGDIVKIVYTDIETGKQIETYQRISQWQCNLYAIYNSTMTCGDKILNYIEYFSQKMIDSDFNSNKDISANNVSYDPNNIPQNKNSMSWIIQDNEKTFQLHKEAITNNSKALADYKAEVTSTYATIQSVAQFKTDTSNALTSIKQTADADRATIELTASYAKKIEGDYKAADGAIIKSYTESMATIKQTADADRASIELTTKYVKQVEIDYKTADGAIIKSYTESMATIKQTADADRANITSNATYIKNVETGYKTADGAIIAAYTAADATIKQEATDTYATITSLATFETNTNSSISAISQTATANEATIKLMTGIEGVANEEGKPRASVIVQSINDQPSSVKIDADNIDLKGITKIYSPYSNVNYAGFGYTGRDFSLYTNNQNVFTIDHGSYSYSDITLSAFQKYFLIINKGYSSFNTTYPQGYWDFSRVQDISGISNLDDCYDFLFGGGTPSYRYFSSYENAIQELFDQVSDLNDRVSDLEG